MSPRRHTGSPGGAGAGWHFGERRLCDYECNRCQRRGRKCGGTVVTGGTAVVGGTKASGGATPTAAPRPQGAPSRPAASRQPAGPRRRRHHAQRRDHNDNQRDHIHRRRHDNQRRRSAYAGIPSTPANGVPVLRSSFMLSPVSSARRECGLATSMATARWNRHGAAHGPAGRLHAQQVVCVTAWISRVTNCGSTDHPGTSHGASSDIPIQVYDMDGDGKSEVFANMSDTEMTVLDGTTGNCCAPFPCPKLVPTTPSPLQSARQGMAAGHPGQDPLLPRLGDCRHRRQHYQPPHQGRHRALASCVSSQ